jgi:Zn-finger nucleic acid-binding protein
MDRFKEPDETMYCPSCDGVYHNSVGRNYSQCPDCEIALVDGARYDEILAEREVVEDE